MSISVIAFERTLHGFSGVFTSGRAWETTKPLLDRLWETIRNEKLSTEGINHFVYTGKGSVFVGVELATYEEKRSLDLEKKEVAMKKYAIWNHRGNFEEIQKG